MRIDNTVVNDYVVNKSIIQDLKNVRVLARSTSFYQLANVRMRNLFYKSGKPGRYVLAMKSHLPNMILTSWPYFGVKLRKKLPIVTLR